MTASAFDSVARDYDATRGGEPRGAQYARELLPRLLEGQSLEVGVGTGVVALGLARQHVRVVGIDISRGMLDAARARLPSQVLLGDAASLPFPEESFGNVYAVWVLHAVSDPSAVIAEMARVLASGGRCLICPTNHPAPNDRVGVEFEEMFRRVEQARPVPAMWTGLSVNAEHILAWGRDCGLSGDIESLDVQSWETTAARESNQIRNKVWSAMRELDEASYLAATSETLAFLDSLPDGPITRRAQAEIVVLNK